MKRLITFIIMIASIIPIMSAKDYFWNNNITFNAPEEGRLTYNSRDRFEMVWYDLTLVVQIYSNRGINDQLLKQNLQHRASDYNMYDTHTSKYNRNSFKGFYLEGTLPDGSQADIYNIVSQETGVFLQVTINYTSNTKKDAKKIIKSIKQEVKKNSSGKKKSSKTSKQPKRKQKVQKKDAPKKPIKKPSATPADLYEI